MDTETRISEAAGTNAYAAIRHLARAAACEELLNDGSHSEGQLWFLVRALCTEHGHSITDTIDSARRYAQQVASNLVNII